MESSSMARYKLLIAKPRPYFAELPYYVWGQVNYDSEGDCDSPLDRSWTWMDLTHRDTHEGLSVSSDVDEWLVTGSNPTAARLAFFLQQRCNATPIDGRPEAHLATWSHEVASARAAKVAANFELACLEPFAQGHLFWGSWKWIGWFGTTFTWIGRWIMDSVVRKDSRAVNLCIDWLREGAFNELQSEVLRYSLNHLTGLTFNTDHEWVDWYDSSGSQQYPEPDFDAWYEDMKALHGE